MKLLEDAYAHKESRLVVIYGRRRVGKSSLVERFAQNKPYFYSFEGIENENTPGQIEHFAMQLGGQVEDPFLLNIKFSNWHELLKYISQRVIRRKSKKKLILFLDELQWMAVGRNKLISLLKYFWDNHFKPNNVMLIMCGSMSSFMVKKVLASKALYGRINLEINLKGLPPGEASKLFAGKRGNEEILKYLFVFGGVPKYLEEIDINKSFNQNINNLCFSKNFMLINEVDKIFYSQFKEAKTYLNIVKTLKNGIYTMNELSLRLGIASGGGLKQYLQNLEVCEIIRSYIPYDKGSNTKYRKYTLSDEFLTFYFKFIEPNLQAIKESNSKRLFEAFTRDRFDIWLGFAFEKFCLKHSAHLATIMGFGEEMLGAAPYFEKHDNRFQIDMLYTRMDKVITICEVKHLDKDISTSIIPEIDRKIQLIKIPRGYTIEKALISLYGPDKYLRDSNYFNYNVTLKDIMVD